MNAPSSVKMLEAGITQNPATLIIAGPRLYAQRLRFGSVDRSPQKLLADLRVESFPVENGKIAILGSPAGLKHEIPLELCIFRTSRIDTHSEGSRNARRGIARLAHNEVGHLRPVACAATQFASSQGFE